MRNKRLRRALLAAPFVLFMVGALWPNAKVPLGRDTTFITAPLANDGLPNYAQAVVDLRHVEVTEENNGAKLLWRAIDPGNLGQKYARLLCTELNIEESAGAFLTDVDDKKLKQDLIDWIAAERAANGAAVPNDENAEQSDCYEIVEQLLKSRGGVRDRPWTASQLPPLSAWLTNNSGSLELLVEAAAQPRMATPAVDLLENPNVSLLFLLDPQSQAIRDAASALSTRAMQHVAEHDNAAAWRDVLACWRFGAHVAAGPTLIEKLLGIALRNSAARATLAILQADQLSEQLARQILQDLEAQPSAINMVESIDHAERYLCLDNILRISTGRLGGLESADDADGGSLPYVFINPTTMLRSANIWFDRAVEAALIDDPIERRQAAEQLEADLDANAAAKGTWTSIAGMMISRNKRSDMMTQTIITLTLPGILGATNATERDQTRMTLTRIAAALALHRLRQGGYPESLSELVAAEVQSVVSDDPYTGKPLAYQRRNDGYLLYSLFENGIDDSGSDFEQPIVEGEWIATEDDSYSRDIAKSDLVIRLPLPPLELPPRQSAQEEAE